MKPALTVEQKKRFIEGFITIVAKASEELQKEFDRNSNINFPIDDNPIIESGVQFRLPPKLKSEFTVLMNKLKSRKL